MIPWVQKEFKKKQGTHSILLANLDLFLNEVDSERVAQIMYSQTFQSLLKIQWLVVERPNQTAFYWCIILALKLLPDLHAQ